MYDFQGFLTTASDAEYASWFDGQTIKFSKVYLSLTGPVVYPSSISLIVFLSTSVDFFGFLFKSF